MEKRYFEILHEILNKVASLKNKDELLSLIDEYSVRTEICNDADMRCLLDDINKIGQELISFKSNETADKTSRLFSTLNDKEKEELSEVLKVISENLFDYHFQPIVSAVDGEIYSFEALMRPKSQLCPSPFHIIKYAELSGKIDDIERTTFLNVLGIIDSKKDSFRERRVFINSIPKARLSAEDFSVVRTLLEKHSDTVVVEMTEQSELGDSELSEIKRIYQSMGVKTAVDDYGTGYSNVQNLIRYMPNYVKIDRSLLSGIQDNQKKRHFVREIIEFCHENGITALAEGVETSEELRTVILLGVDLIQGYYTAKPSPVILDSIPYEIKQEIKRYRQEREDGKKLQIYTCAVDERVLLDRLVKENYKCILVGKKGDGDVSIVCSPGLETKMHIRVENNFKGSITLENAYLSNVKNRPCIDIGENCDVRLLLSGNNQLKKGGIRVPESSRFVCSGEGGLSIYVDGSNFYGVGNDFDARHGELVFEQGITIENHSATGVCIGSGLGGKINIIRGQFSLIMRGYIGVGIGALNADTDLELFACDITADLTLQQGVAIGSLEKSCKAHIQHSAIKCFISGSEIVGIGTLMGEKCDTSICEASVIINISADKCSSVSALTGETSLKINKAGVHITSNGDNALAFGGFTDKNSIQFLNSDVSANLATKADYKKYVTKDSLDISGGRTRFTVNDVNLLSK